MKIALSFIVLLLALYKVITSFLLDEKYGILFDMKINIWLYRIIWTLAGLAFAYAIFKSYKNKRQFGL